MGTAAIIKYILALGAFIWVARLPGGSRAVQPVTGQPQSTYTTITVNGPATFYACCCFNKTRGICPLHGDVQAYRREVIRKQIEK